MGITFHRNPQERRWFEKILRRFIMPPHPPLGLPWGGWDKREKTLKRHFPVRWFFWEAIPDFWRLQTRRYQGMKNWIRYRTWDKYHVIKMDLTPNYYDPDTQMLWVNFQILKDFIEIELAAWHSDEPEEPETNQSISKTLNRFGRNFRRMRRKKIRQGANGLAHLDWEIAETTGQQQISAIEKKELYDWWVNVRPYRADPLSYELIWGKDYQHDLRRISSKSRQAFALSSNLSDFYDKEDEEMLIRLIQIRKSLWT